MKAPKHLSHKPIVEAADYDAYDGIYAHKTDAKALSLGLAQWNLDELSVKVWRKPNDTWSPQSEELPPHRALDLAYLVARVYDDVSSHAVKNYEIGQILPGYTDFTVSVVEEDENVNADAFAKKMECLEAYFKEHEDVIRRRLKALKDQLNAMPGI